MTNSSKLTSKKRESLDRSRDDFTFQSLGLKFPFLNREVQCKLLYEIFKSNDNVRKQKISNEDSWESKKRDLKLPVAVGMAGIGKTSLGKEGFFKHIDLLRASGGAEILNDDFFNNMSLTNVLNIRICKLKL